MARKNQHQVIKLLRAESIIPVPDDERQEMLRVIDAVRADIVKGNIFALSIATLRRGGSKMRPEAWIAPQDTDVLRMIGALRHAEFCLTTRAATEAAQEQEEVPD